MNGPATRRIDSSSHDHYEPRMKTHIHLLAAALLFSFVGNIEAADAATTFKAGEFTFKQPAKWERIETASPMRKAQFKVNDADKKNSAEVVFFHFGPSNGGGVQANVERWYGQFEGPREKIGAKSEETTIGKRKVTFVRAEGVGLSPQHRTDALAAAHASIPAPLRQAA